MKKLLQKHFLFILYLIFFISLIAYRVILHVTPFYDWDESLYVETGREMFDKHYFLAPVWQGVPWFDKPPLIPFLYGLVMKVFFFVPPEISTRLFTLSVAILVLILLYKLYLRAAKDTLIAILAIILTSLTPIFFQRSQVVNLDVFLLLGWVGYVLFFENFWLSAAFLLISVLSKSLIGFYAPVIVGIFYFFQYLIKKIDFSDLKKIAAKIFLHIGISLIWFILMFALYGKQFFYQQIIESHFRRVTSSIEFHFGKKTYYLDLAVEQMGSFAWIAIVGLIVSLKKLFIKKTEWKELFFGLYLLPWFIFLNLTKTKIFWYFFPAIPQLAFLAVLPLNIFKKHKVIYYFLSVLIVISIFNVAFLKNNYVENEYSRYENYYYLATYARNKCNSLTILLNPEKRQAFATLDKLGLLITTTKWWGEHPSVVYYFEKKVNFIYDQDMMYRYIISSIKNNCFVLETSDIDQARMQNLKTLKNFGVYNLFIR